MKTLPLLYWTPRVLCVLAILFVSMFALDAFDPKLSLGQQILGFLIHLTPVYFLIVMLVVAWKWELVGGIILAAFGLIASPFIFVLNYHRIHSVGGCLLILLMITFPFILTGLLFVWHHYQAKNLVENTPTPVS
jgi:hypothetical protein